MILSHLLYSLMILSSITVQQISYTRCSNVESYSYLTGGINDTATTLAYANDLFSVEEEDALGAGAIIEVGQELMFSTALNTVSNEITVTRGARGTTATSHSAGDLIKISPAFPRKNVYDAVVDQIENLYPDLRP